MDANNNNTNNNNWQCSICGQKKGHPEHDFCRDCNRAYFEIKDDFPSRMEWKKYVLENPEIRAQIVLRHLERAQYKCHFLAKKTLKILEAVHIESEISTN